MMSEFKKQFDDIQEAINQKKVEKAKLEERMENIQKDIEGIREDLKELDIDENELDDVIKALEKDIKEELEKCEKALK